MPVILALLIIASTAQAGQRVWFRSWVSATELADILREISKGREILAKAEKKDPKILSKVQSAAASTMEDFSSTQLRAFDGSDQSKVEQQVKLKTGLPLSDAVADFAHELTHFNAPPFDPYVDGLHFGKFVRNSIEGEGGELQAFRAECETAWALEANDPAFPRHQLCEKYRGAGNSFQVSAATKDFYALGTYYSKASPELRKAFPELSEMPVAFKSGASGKPYPISLSNDFAGTRQKYCSLNRQKYLLTEHPAKGSGVTIEKLMAERKRLENFANENCKNGR
jgi:hypothetical protein